LQVFTVIIIIAILILVHELGHFLAAKALKVPVKTFSIGFPFGDMKPLFHFQKGETDYQLNPIPLGGFCAFMDDDKEIERQEDDKRFLLNRKVWERFIVISGGVTGNLIFAFLVSFVMFFALGIPEGREYNDGVTIIDVSANSPAEKGGMKRLDQVIAVDNVRLNFLNNDLENIFNGLLSNTKKNKISIIDNNGKFTDKFVSLDKEKNVNIKTEEATGILITKVFENTIAEKAGLKTNDILLEVNNNSFKDTNKPEQILHENIKTAGKNQTPVNLNVLRNGNIISLNVTPNSQGLIGIGIQFIKGLNVVSIEDNSIFKKEGININNVIIAINDNPLADTSSIMKKLISKHSDQTPAKVTVLRQNKEVNLDVIPSPEGLIGVQIQSTVEEIKRAPKNIVEPFVMGTLYIADTTVRLTEALIQLFTGKVSLKELGGPIMVVAIGSEIAQSDLAKLFPFTILISIELVILNLLPLPALDGGHLFFLIIEKIRGRRLPREIEEKIHYAGLIVLLGLGVFLIFKDILTLSKIIR